MASSPTSSPTPSPSPRVLLLEPFYGGSHRQLLELLQQNISGCFAVTLPARKWHWRARTAALHLSQATPPCPSYQVLFCSSVLNLCELVALRPDLARLKKVLYFHENQLAYPVQKDQERDFQYGYNQILSCLVADVVVFNSAFNMESFLTKLRPFLKKIPDQRPQDLDLDLLIRPKCLVLAFPLQLPDLTRLMNRHKLQRQLTEESHLDDILAARQQVQPSPWMDRDQESPQGGATPEGGGEEQARPLHIVWPHRWEHDKGPELFFTTMMDLKQRGCKFLLSVLGETFTDPPEIFLEAQQVLQSHILHWGFLPSKDHFLSVLCQADVVVSTAKHEFFGVAMLEAVHCGCYPLCPKALVYPEIFPEEYLYATPQQLSKRLRSLCTRPQLARTHLVKVDTSRYSWASLKESYQQLLSVPEEGAKAPPPLPQPIGDS